MRWIRLKKTSSEWIRVRLASISGLLFQDLGLLRQSFQPLHMQAAFGKEHHPGGEEDEFEVGEEGEVVLISEFQLAFVGRDVPGVEFFGIPFAVAEQILLVPEHNGPDAGEAGTDIVDAGFHMLWIGIKGFVHQRAGADDAHVAFEDIDELGQLVDFGFAQETAHRQHPRIPAGRVQSAAQVRTRLEHGGEFPDVEGGVVQTDPLLEIKNLMLAGEAEDEADGQQQGRKHQQRQGGEKDVEEAFEEGGVHGVGVRLTPRRGGRGSSLRERRDGRGSSLRERRDGRGSSLRERRDGRGSSLRERRDGRDAAGAAQGWRRVGLISGIP